MRLVNNQWRSACQAPAVHTERHDGPRLEASFSFRFLKWWYKVLAFASAMLMDRPFTSSALSRFSRCY